MCRNLSPGVQIKVHTYVRKVVSLYWVDEKEPKIGHSGSSERAAYLCYCTWLGSWVILVSLSSGFSPVCMIP